MYPGQTEVLISSYNAVKIQNQELQKRINELEIEKKQLEDEIEELKIRLQIWKGDGSYVW